MGAAGATLKQGGGANPRERHPLSHTPRPIEAPAVGSHVKPAPEIQSQNIISENRNSMKSR